MSESRPNVFCETFAVNRGGLHGQAVAAPAGAEQLGGTVYELDPGVDGMPLHIHHAMEELAIVLTGHPTLRTLEGESLLEPGDVVAFPCGHKGAHTLVNRSDEKVRFIMLSTKQMPELVEYPEQGIVMVATRPPFYEPADGEDPRDNVRLRFRVDDAVK